MKKLHEFCTEKINKNKKTRKNKTKMWYSLILGTDSFLYPSLLCFFHLINLWINFSKFWTLCRKFPPQIFRKFFDTQCKGIVFFNRIFRWMIGNRYISHCYEKKKLFSYQVKMRTVRSKRNVLETEKIWVPYVRVATPPLFSKVWS